MPSRHRGGATRHGVGVAGGELGLDPLELGPLGLGAGAPGLEQRGREIAGDDVGAVGFGTAAGAAEETGDRALLARLRANLERFERGERPLADAPRRRERRGPTTQGGTRPCRLAPPMSNMASSTRKVVKLVFNERPRVSIMLWFTATSIANMGGSIGID